MERFYWERSTRVEWGKYDPARGFEGDKIIDNGRGYSVYDRHGQGDGFVAMAFTADLAEQIVRALNAKSVS